MKSDPTMEEAKSPVKDTVAKDDLKELLHSPKPDFNQIADKLMNYYKLKTPDGMEYRICEIEFYFKDDGAHNDTFTHCDPTQQTCGKWYMHRLNPKNRMSFKGGTYKGMDLSFGGEGNHGGILIRAVQSLTNPVTYIEGPCNTLSMILKANGVEDCRDMKLKSWPHHDGDAFDP